MSSVTEAATPGTQVSQITDEEIFASHVAGKLNVELSSPLETQRDLSIAYTPGGCTDESDAVRDFTFTPTAAPGLSEPFFPFCCRIR